MGHVSLFYGHLVYFMAIWCILWPSGIFCGHLVYFVIIWCIFPRFGMFCKNKSGNPAARADWRFLLQAPSASFDVGRLLEKPRPDISLELAQMSGRVVAFENRTTQQALQGSASSF
jgi:hypothetical protein